MATHSSVLAWRIPGTGDRDGAALWAAVYGVAQSQTQLKQLSSGSMPAKGGEHREQIYFFLYRTET